MTKKGILRSLDADMPRTTIACARMLKKKRGLTYIVRVLTTTPTNGGVTASYANDWVTVYAKN